MVDHVEPPPGAPDDGGAWRRIGRLWRDLSGHALIEGAIVFTILPFLFLGVSEYSEADLVSKRLDAAAGASSDLVARLQTVSSAELNAMKDNLINEMIKPFPAASFGLVITSVVTDSGGTSTVAWSHARGGSASARTTGSGVTLPEGLAEPSSSLIMTEVSYSFSSTLTTMIAGSVPLSAAAYSAPRVATQVEKTN
jgi:Flp pilus assembly protein TadG